ncbi:hypothetical protein F4802DRAFT_409758 [Xylaria palmicola]|nr:hypothetical protein F4802DRAFT_409758 [Xylaria palmicola]
MHGCSDAIATELRKGLRSDSPDLHGTPRYCIAGRRKMACRDCSFSVNYYDSTRFTLRSGFSPGAGRDTLSTIKWPIWLMGYEMNDPGKLPNVTRASEHCACAQWSALLPYHVNISTATPQEHPLTRIVNRNRKTTSSRMDRARSEGQGLTVYGALLMGREHRDYYRRRIQAFSVTPHTRHMSRDKTTALYYGTANNRSATKSGTYMWDRDNKVTK